MVNGSGESAIGVATSRPRLRCLLSSVPSDAHTWSLVILELLLEELGHDVTNLGPCPPEDLILAECRRSLPHLLVLSTSNGHGWLDAERLIRRIRADRALAGLRVVIGGKLHCARGDAERIASLRVAGFDAVFTEADGLRPFIAMVHGLASGLGASVAPRRAA